MKQITAIIRPHRLEQVETALHGLPHFPGFTVLAAHGHPRGHGHDHAFNADEWEPDHHTMLTLLMFCADDQANAIVDTISKAAHTGQRGDGLIAIQDLAEIVRIRTGERGDAAV